MPSAVTKIDDLISARFLRRGDFPGAPRRESWSLENLEGRMVELCAAAAPAGLTAAMGLVRLAQASNETAVWVTTAHDCFYPPDAAEGGVVLSRMPVVRIPLLEEIPLAADKLVRSGAFDLVVMDLSSGFASKGAFAKVFPKPLQSRIAALARKHGTAVVVLSGRRSGLLGLGPMISMKSEASREPEGLEVRAVKDRLSPSGWSRTEPCRGPAGLR